ncbi:SDR family oxidoreductase [Sinosporangium siamense]|uniref:NmrA-like domain-containing protein n=1 Tax=Sinosporangium siamense TaxID=1367973 RepID=A0A919RN60_9ACTN|nr:NAD(P)H-binding protein [Sinosporangium siamense]GII95930.1 hypothetical protein Ssi02_61610 [Sinosporangium siamense]
MSERRKILVIGASGNVSRHVVDGLVAAGAEVRALTRSTSAAAFEPPAGVEVVHGDLREPETLRPALDGVQAVFLLWPYTTAEGAQAAVDVIAAPGRHIVYLSAMAVSEDRSPPGERPVGAGGARHPRASRPHLRGMGMRPRRRFLPRYGGSRGGEALT